MSPRTMVSSYGPALASPRWAGDFGSRDYLVPGGSKLRPEQFTPDDAQLVTAGAAALNAVALPVTALTVRIPKNTLLYFAANKQVTTTADAEIGAVSLAVQPLQTAMVGAETAFYGGTGKKHVPSGTVVGRTYAERDLGTDFGPAADTDEEFFLIFNDVDDADRNPDIELYRPGGTVYENLLPVWTALSATVKAALRARYQCTQLLES